jgi:hypothetical protein
VNKIKKYITRKNIIFVSLLICIFTISFSFCYSYFVAKGTITSSSDSVEVFGFGPRVNVSHDRIQYIDLASTITNNKTLAPGAEGKFKIIFEFDTSDFSEYYKLYIGDADLPDNLHFYVDKDYTTEFNKFEGVYHNESYIGEIPHMIYWKWDYVDSEEANANDNLYMNKDITVPFIVDVSQRVDNRTVYVNSYEVQTGDYLMIGKTGSIDISLKFSNLNPTNYIVYLDKNEGASNAHFYSDSAYTNEITSISGYYNGTNNIVKKTIYWKTDDSYNAYGMGYYAVYLP